LAVLSIFVSVLVSRIAAVQTQTEKTLRAANEELEQRVKARTLELERANAELQRFAYATSHDLREPLRTISGHLQIINRRYRDKLDSDAREFIEFAIDGATRLHALIESLLEYSYIGELKELKRRHVDCEKLLAFTLEALRKAIEESEAVITHDPLPTIDADDVHVRQLFQNLIANAIKYRRDVRPEIHVSAIRKGDDWIFSVRDNGEGIAPEHFDKVFQVFQRLHGLGHSGAGIGLATCQRIVELYGGRIWVESEVGRGSTFRFAIPTGTSAK
jgi:two-component system, chemotaxis family, sensor kinase Cph1